MHIMLDMETLGNDPAKGAVIGIGATVFQMDREIPEPRPIDYECNCITNYYSHFYCVTDTTGYQIEQDTLDWWHENDEKVALFAQYSRRKDKLPFITACQLFMSWVKSLDIHKKEVYLWSHGATFDVMHLAQKYEQTFHVYLEFRNVRDTRTLIHLYKEKFSEPYFIERKMKHHPLNDAYCQAVETQYMWNALLK